MSEMTGSMQKSQTNPSRVTLSLKSGRQENSWSSWLVWDDEDQRDAPDENLEGDGIHRDGSPCAINDFCGSSYMNLHTSSYGGVKCQSEREEGGEREREARERERDTHRETHTERDTQRETQREGERARGRGRGRGEG